MIRPAPAANQPAATDPAAVPAVNTQVISPAKEAVGVPVATDIKDAKDAKDNKPQVN